MSNAGSRWQRGTLTKSGSHWVLRLRQDETGPDGKTVRRERSHRVGALKDVRSESHARALADVLAERITGLGANQGASIMAANYLRRYMNTHLIAKKPASQTTIRSRIVAHLLPGVGRQRLEQVNGATAQGIVSAMLAKELHSTTIRDVIRLLYTIMRKAKDDGFACQPVEPRSVSLPAKVEVDVERQTFKADEVARLVAGSAMPWRLAYALQGTLGLRCAEVLGLAWRDFEGNSVRIRRSAVRGRIQSLKSKTSCKTMVVPSELQPLLAELRASWQANEHDLLFCADGGPVLDGSYRAQLHKDLKALGLPKRGTHAFRHFVASHLLASGVGVSAARDHMRHASITMTDRYSHAMSGDMRGLADTMGAVIGKAINVSALVAKECGDAHASDAARTA